MTGRSRAAGQRAGGDFLRLRVSLLTAAVVAGTLLLLGLAAYVLLAGTLREQLDRSLVDRAQVISGRLPSALAPSGAAVAPPDVDAITAGGAVAQVYVLAGGDVVRSANLGPGDLPVTPRAIRAARRGEPAFETVPGESAGWRLYSAPLRLDGQPIGFLQVAQPLGGLSATLTLLRTGLIGVTVGGAGASFLLTWWLLPLVGRPGRRSAGSCLPEAFEAALLARLHAAYTRGELTLTEYEADLRRLLLRAPGGEPSAGAGAASSRPTS